MSSFPRTPISISRAEAHTPGHDGKPIEPLRTPVNGLITPPESPIEDITQSQHYSPNREVFVHPSGPSIVMVGGIGYDPGHIRFMANELAHARQNGEFPQTTTPLMHVESLVQDYGDLSELRRARGDFAAPVSEAYRHLLVDITRRIQERDASLNEHAKQAEVARRVGTYLHSVEQERRLYDVASNMLQRRGVVQPTQMDLDNVSEEICAIVEHSMEQSIEQSVECIEHTMADATGPLRMNVGTFKDQNTELGRQISLQHLALEQQSSTVKALQALINPQSTNLQTMTHNLALVNGIVGQLSQVMVNMPVAVDQAVSQAVSHAVSNAVNLQAEEAIKNVMHAQQQAMTSLHAEYDRLRSEGRVEATFVRDVEDRKFEAPSSTFTPSGDYLSQKRRFQGQGRKGKGKLRKLMLKVMRYE